MARISSRAVFVSGIMGIPIVEIAEEAINLGIRFIGSKNEQVAGYAASAYGYLTGRPGVWRPRRLTCHGRCMYTLW